MIKLLSKETRCRRTSPLIKHVPAPGAAWQERFADFVTGRLCWLVLAIDGEVKIGAPHSDVERVTTT
jgi:hypothetical protein